MSQKLNPMEGPKWEACASVWRHYAEEPDDKFRVDFQRKHLAGTPVEALRTAALTWIEQRTTPPTYWSDFWKLVPQSETKAGSKPAEKTGSKPPEKVDDWWGNEGEWRGEWKGASGRSMIIPAATMTVNARGKYFQNRAMEFRNLAIRRGADPELMQRAIEHIRGGRSLNHDVLKQLDRAKELSKGIA
jgi:hypothetical protein